MRPAILLVEDESPARAMLQAILTEAGYAVTEVVDGGATLRLLRLNLTRKRLHRLVVLLDQTSLAGNVTSCLHASADDEIEKRLHGEGRGPSTRLRKRHPAWQLHLTRQQMARAESLANAYRRGLASGRAAAAGDSPWFLADRVLLTEAWRMSCAGAVGQSEEAQVDYFVAWVHGYVVRAEQLEDAACLRVIDA